MRLLKFLWLPILALLTCCGTVVPNLQDVTQPDANVLIKSIIRSVRCEIADAVTGAIRDDLVSTRANALIDPKSPLATSNASDFLKNWGVQVALQLQSSEKTTVNPTGLFTPAQSGVSLAGGLTGSAEATRIDKMNYYYKVSELYLGEGRKCDRNTIVVPGSLLIQSDLKLREWLSAQVNAVALLQMNVPIKPNGPWKQNVLQHEVRFEVITAGTLTPTLRLVEGSFNPSGSFFTASRNRYHDLIVTFGPLDRSQLGSFLIPIAETAHTNALLSSDLRNIRQF